VPVVAAAGNDDEERLHFPAGYSSGISVAATDNKGTKATFSNYQKDVKISAPGVNIYSAFGEGQFAWWSGTSQASPMVAGVVAMIRSVDPTLRPNEIERIIIKSGKNIDKKNKGLGKGSKMGGGMTDALEVLDEMDIDEDDIEEAQERAEARAAGNGRGNSGNGNNNDCRTERQPTRFDVSQSGTKGSRRGQ
jgi:subtilisin family serine protease